MLGPSAATPFSLGFVKTVGSIYDLRAGDTVVLRSGGYRSIAQLFWFKNGQNAADGAELLRLCEAGHSGETHGVPIAVVRAFHGHGFVVSQPARAKYWTLRRGWREACVLFGILVKAGF